MNTFRLLNRFLAISVLTATAAMADQVVTNTDIATSTTTEQTAKMQPAIPLTLLLKQLSQQVILPLYDSANQEVTELNKQVISFCNTPNLTHLETTRSQWSKAVSAWSMTEVALFGPALTKQRDLHIYFRPVKKRVIKKLLAQETDITLENLDYAGVGAQGFATMEYLLFNRDMSDTDLLAHFTGDNNKYCQHLLATSTLLQHDIVAIHREWKGGYANLVETAGNAENTEFPSDKQALEFILGKTDQLAEGVINKLRHALGKNAHLAGKDDAREKTNAYKLEAWRSGHTLQNILSNIRGIEQVMQQGGMLKRLKELGNNLLAQKIEQQIVTIKNIDFSSQDLFTLIEKKDLAAADQLFSDAQSLSRLIQEAAPKFGIQLGFNDSDGD